MEISPEIIKNLLVTLVNPKYPELIHDYMVKSKRYEIYLPRFCCGGVL